MNEILINSTAPSANTPELNTLDAGTTITSELTMGNQPIDPSLLGSDYANTMQQDVLASPLIQDRITEFLNVGVLLSSESRSPGYKNGTSKSPFLLRST